jgi:hypothetical protein
MSSAIGLYTLLAAFVRSASPSTSRTPCGWVCCEKIGSPTLQTHQYPILLLPWLWVEAADQTLTLATTPAGWCYPPSTTPLGVTYCLCRRPNTCWAVFRVALTLNLLPWPNPGACWCSKLLEGGTGTPSHLVTRTRTRSSLAHPLRRHPAAGGDQGNPSDVRQFVTELQRSAAAS